MTRQKYSIFSLLRNAVSFNENWQQAWRSPAPRKKYDVIIVAGHASVLAEMAGLRLPLESHPLQAYVSEPLKPVLDTVVMSNAVHGYISQSDKGELVVGAGIDAYNGYGQRGPRAREVLARGCTLDLHPRSFKPGQCAQSTLAKTSMLIALVEDAPTFNIIIRRSFAEYAARWLRHSGASVHSHNSH